MDTLKAGVSGLSAKSSKTPVRMIPASEYARMDVACRPVYEAMLSTSCSGKEPSITNDVCVDGWPLIANREKFYLRMHEVSVNECFTDFGCGSRHAEDGDQSSVRIIGNHPMRDGIIRKFSSIPFAQDSNKLYGTIIHIWQARIAGLMVDLDNS